MNTEPNINRCPKCHAPLPANAPQGLCPKCLLAAAATPTEAGQPADKTPPPPIAAVAAAFPQLEIIELIGRGGMGAVYKARQPKLDRLVALKLLPQSLAADATFAERFNREARVLARLNHPSIVTVHDFGQSEGFFYLLMEFVDGVNLRQAIQAGRFTPQQAMMIVPKICEALQFAHDEGVLHRDIKPENILLDTRGRVKIADFGIAKLVGEAREKLTLTASGAAVGTPHYMAPEQLEHPEDVDQRADIYSLGVVFYEMLTGELPIGRFAPPSQKSEADPRVDDIVLRALEKEREKRYRSANEVKTSVEAITYHAEAEPAGTGGMGRTGSRRWIWAGVGILAGLLLLQLAVLLIFVLGRGTLRQTQLGAASSLVGQSEGRFVLHTMPPSKKPAFGAPSGTNQLKWAFKCLVPPEHMARILFVRWTNGVPVVETASSAYYKVGKTAMDQDLYVTCVLSADAVFPDLTNTVCWMPALFDNVIYSLRLPRGPPYRRLETPERLTVRTGHQGILRLVDYVTPEAQSILGHCGVELRILLEPLQSPPIRTDPLEVEGTNYVAGPGLNWRMDQAQKAIKEWPVDE